MISNVEEIVKSGIQPFEMRYHNVISCQFNSPCALQSELWVNSLDVGVLKSQQYLPVTLRNNQCVEMFLWSIEHVANQILADGGKSLTEWVSVYAPVRILTKAKSGEKMKKLFDGMGFTETGKICLEFPQEILYEEQTEIENELQKLKDMGFKIAVSGYGNELCPTIRLADIKPDIAILDEYVTHCIEKDKIEQANHVIEYANRCGCQVVLSGVTNEEMTDIAFSLGCTSVTGKIFGKPRKTIVIR